MKILQLGKFYPILGGVEKVMYDLVDGLAAKDIHCDMLCASLSKQSHRLKLHSKGNILCKKAIVKLFNTMISPSMISFMFKKKKAYDLIHIHHPDPMAAISLFCSGFKGPVILHWHSDILSQKLMLKVYRPLQNWLINRSTVIVGTTPKYLKESPFLSNVKSKTVAIPIGIDPVESKPEQTDIIRKRYPNKKIVFSLGRLVEYKGFRYLIEAAQYLPNDYVILIGGNGPLKDKLSQLIKDNQLEHKVFLLGRIGDDELCAYYSASDLFCLSSIWKTEAFGIVQIEAMSCGKPIVATNIEGSGVSWVNEHQKSGLNVNPNDSKGIADAITKILSNPEVYKKYSEGALQRYNEFFRKDIMINKCIELYNSLI